MQGENSFQPFLDQLAQDLQGVLPPEEVKATVADARAHLHDLQSRLIAEGMPPDLAVQQALLDYGDTKSLAKEFKPRKAPQNGAFSAFYLTCVLGFFSPYIPAIHPLFGGIDYLGLPWVAWIYLALMLVMMVVSITVRRVAWKTCAKGLAVFLVGVLISKVIHPTAMSMPFLYYLPFATAWYLALFAIPHLLGVGIGSLIRLIVRLFTQNRGGNATT